MPATQRPSAPPTPRPAPERPSGSRAGPQAAPDTRTGAEAGTGTEAARTVPPPIPVTPVTGRIPVLDVRPVVQRGLRPAKAVTGETFEVSATVFREGHDAVAANVVLKDYRGNPGPWTPMRELAPGTDRWGADVTPDAPGLWTYAVEAWSDPVSTWRHHARIKIPAGIDTELVLEEGARLYERVPVASGVLAGAVSALRNGSLPPAERLRAALTPEVDAVLAAHPLRELVTSSEELPLLVERERALFGSWYEFFPRSEGTSEVPHGTFRTAARRLPEIAAMGFDVVYLPPIHPIGTTFRKGRNNSLTPTADDVGVPWAIGSPEGGHDAVHPALGTLDDFAWFVSRAGELGLEVALDFALQCSPDHPWVHQHPEWFHHRPDGTIAYAENPPKKYQDIYPLAFDADMEGLVAETLRVLRHWMAVGVRIFRVDNPHTKPVVFWERVIGEIGRTDPDVVFLAEAFTRPAMMRTLGEIGFQQSYTYFTWRTTKDELTEYLTELSRETAASMRPNFFTNTPDILHEYLQHGGRPAFEARAVLAATLSPSWGIYSGYELCENTPLRAGSEEYHDSEKYQLRVRDWESAPSIAPLITRLNEVRRSSPALRQLRNLHFHHADKDAVIAYSKTSGSNTVLTIVNLDPHHTQEATVSLDMPQLGLDWHESVPVRDELTGETYDWGRANYVRLEPGSRPAHVLTVLRPSHPQIGGSATR
ncbi:alpha-1,4-glucan--maltose-1-phosphate maltosyltransferase [Streptomyces acidiscabies]|uniref:Alpha-1,4-glucan:maltose-1-phosphate maltosyltransferase n=1 Tax=Streptomyces acidiscabies TaxID=42234 RepID=A0AAP6EI89_9ACTN|nr:alpha-1,4-glucan--maltose-1-phosphate maltosyltransferase [Streptomyces acidiscabies]MBP5936815.1 alpha-1,4-glucan--maltose-1-phosphate maltosyltransferase [Streptomyces sp. LBUM 1476]MDX2963679.1 alpha-1,4-glucan--maltose-1-phosphate maltosyltransferase [Streptomyces acidiscabies]MDX3021238.1 alpha-1,4-glucan--maltose-1-phosphate maltosyltransferase [Streptomyces acidiscabies]MDX3793509.1 alpha-1,4-glucan--maltose-1-phosphate maltosyltransferase [Streptomyces acidiscabies]